MCVCFYFLFEIKGFELRGVGIELFCKNRGFGVYGGGVLGKGWSLRKLKYFLF